MLRLQDFHCATDGVFEQLLELDPRDGDARFEKVRSHACPKCGESAPGIIGAPRVQTTVTAVEVGGRLYRRDDLEAMLEEPSEKPKSFLDDPNFERDFLERTARFIKQDRAGELAPEATSMPDQVATSALAGVNAEAAVAAQEKVTQFMRTTEFPE